MTTPIYTVTGTVELFRRPGGWHYVRVPATVSDELASFADRGLVAIRARVGDTWWDTSLLPMGDGTHFIALNAAVRRANALDVGETTTVSFTRRTR